MAPPRAKRTTSGGSSGSGGAGASPSSGKDAASRLAAGAEPQRRFWRSAAAGALAVALALALGTTGGSQRGNDQFPNDLPDVPFDEARLPSFKKKDVKLSDEHVVMEWLHRQPGLREAKKALRHLGYEASGLYVQTCEDLNAERLDVARPHIIILSAFFTAMGFVHLGPSSKDLCDDDSLNTPPMQQMLQQVADAKGLLIVNNYGADCIRGSVCGPEAPRLRHVLCLCRPAGWASSKADQHYAFTALDELLDQPPVWNVTEGDSVSRAYRGELLPKGLRARDVLPATWVLQSKADGAQLMAAAKSRKYSSGFFAKPSVSLKSRGAVPLPSTQALGTWLQSMRLPLRHPYIVQELVARPMLTGGRASIFRAFVALLSVSPPQALVRIGRVNVGGTRFVGGTASDSQRYVVSSDSGYLMPFKDAVASAPGAVGKALAQRIRKAVQMTIAALVLDSQRGGAGRPAGADDDGSGAGAAEAAADGEGPQALAHLCVDLMFERGAPRVLEVNSNCGLRLIGVDYSPSLAEDLGLDLSINALLQSLASHAPEGLREKVPKGGWQPLFDDALQQHQQQQQQEQK